MNTRQPSLSIKRTLFPYGFTSEYRLEVALPKFHLPILVDASLRMLLPKEVLEKKSILDIKGRDSTSLLNNNLKDAIKPKAEELFFLSGKILLSRDKAEEEIWEPFEVRVHTAFESFIGNHHISHTILILRAGAIPPFLDIWDLGRAFPILPQHFRLGLEFFSSSFIFASLGFVPTVRETLLIESTEDETIIGIKSEGLKRKDQMPLSKGDYLEKIAAVAKETFGFDIVEDYRSRCNP